MSAANYVTKGSRGTFTFYALDAEHACKTYTKHFPDATDITATLQTAEEARELEAATRPALYQPRNEND